MMDPCLVTFKAAKGRPRSCSGCLFEHERASVCRIASAEAVKRGLPDCEYPDAEGRSIIYVAVPVDERQGDLFELPKFVTGENACACKPGCCELPANLCRDWVKRGAANYN
jgi:hypothetical protein